MSETFKVSLSYKESMYIYIYSMFMSTVCVKERINLFLLFFVQKAPIDPFTRERCKPSASQGVPLGGMGYIVDTQ